ncbi:MAG: NAD(+)/NADH kinase [Lachnospiraceae bacterium]|nr:NAD(+)/NADH kinase [Lachnospiraceae bacterium]
MKYFYIVSNSHKDEGFRLRDQICRYLEDRGAVCVRHEDADIPPDGTECVITLGGDGTLLRTVRRYADMGLSYIGINTGTVGYLTEGDPGNAETILDALLADEFLREKRMMIYGRLFRNGKAVSRHRALNDVTVGRSLPMKMANLHVSVNGQFLKDYRCDVLIAATPTGSTAYNFSAGGPIVEPTAQLFLLTPLAAHSLNSRTLVLSPTDRVQIQIIPPSAGNEGKEGYLIYFDGEKPEELKIGDVLEITRATTYINILKLSERSFVETLRSKLSE